MTWFDSIYDLQYYNQPKGVPCYCEALTYPHDLQLQGTLDSSVSNYTIKFYVYSADGVTQYEDATTYFEYYFGKVSVNGLNHHFFNARLKSYTPAMCQHACYILRVVVTGNVNGQTHTLFDKYTERYCQTDCCDVAKNISIDQDGLLIGGGSGSGTGTATEGIDDRVFTPGNPTGTGVPGVFTPVTPPPPTGACGEPLIRLVSSFDCIDNFTGVFYGVPDTTLSGTTANFQYVKVSTFKGRVVRKPREISREISYNCRLQSAESTPVYQLEGFEFFPAWKMYEIESQLHAKYIYVDDYGKSKRYEYAGDTPFSQASNCFELFKLSATLQDCTQRQLYSCAPACNKATNPDGSNILFAIPQGYQGGAFYDEQRVKVANNYEGLKDYLRTRDGVSAINEVSTESLDCTVQHILTVTSDKSMTASIYYDEPTLANQLLPLVVNEYSDVCAVQPAYCAMPVVGDIINELAVCDIPEVNSFSVDAIVPEEVSITGFGDWEEDALATEASVWNGQVTFSIKVVNDQIAEDPEAVGESVAIPSDIIGVIGGAARPTVQAVLNSGNSNLPEDVHITIDEFGMIRYSGASTAATASDVTITINNLTYNI